MPEPVVKVSTVPEFRSYFLHQLILLSRKLRVLILIAALLLVCFLLSPVTYNNLEPLEAYRSGIALLVLPGIIFVLLPVNVYLAAKKRWRDAPELSAPKTYLFDNTGITITSDEFHTRIKWSMLVSARLTTQTLFLASGQEQFFIVPLKDLNQPERDRLLDLVRNRLPLS